MAGSPLSSLFRLQPFSPGEDPAAAPGSFKGDDAAPRWTWRRARQNQAWIYALGLIFLLFMVPDLIAGDPGPGEFAARLVLVVAIAVAYFGTAWVADLPLWVRYLYIGLFLILLGLTWTFLSWGFAYFGIFVAVMLATLIPWRQSRIAIGVWALVGLGAWLASGQLGLLSIGLTGLFIGWATGGGIEAGRLGARLNQAEQRVSVLAVAAERERIARDLHDLLGHSLTAISIKSGLAGKLLEHDLPAARAEMADIESIARQALADVRATTSGYRSVRVATEIASARSVLLAAGIEARTPSAVDPLPDATSELFGYVVREAVTNVVRHSDAATCTIEVTADEVRVMDDGHGFDAADRTRGSGLRGLAARLETAGGLLEVESGPGRGTRLRARSAAPEPSAQPGAAAEQVVRS